MLAGDDENQQLTSGPRHLRDRRFRHATPFGLPAVKPKAPRPSAVTLKPFWERSVLPQKGLVAVAALALALTFTATDRPAEAPGPKAAQVAAAASPERSEPGTASRGKRRTETKPGTTPETKPATTPEATTATAAPAPARTGPTVADPVGGLSRAEMDNAIAIVDVAKRENLPKRAAIVALATALQESHLRNLANPNLPQSLNHPNQGVGYDYDSVGLFQQRPNWGGIDQLMDPHESARRFYAALTRIPGWGDYRVTVAAQMVQGSAFPDAYAKWESLATQIADATM